MNPQKQEIINSILTRNVASVISRDSLLKKLHSGKKLRIKLGCDPTRPDLHLGHALVLRMLRRFQELGHHVIFIVGDFTAHIGDPAGRSVARKAMTLVETKKNARTYFQQAGRILDLKKAEIRSNSEWLSKLKLEEILRLNAQFTISRILERDDFKKRLEAGAEVWMHELQYPLIQAYDSVVVGADVEIGGADQLFNFIAARHLMERLGLPGQDIITYEIIPGLDGKEKMSKSLDNYIGITEPPASIFGKIMSLPDKMIVPYFKLTTERSDSGIDEIERRLEKGENPRDLKLELARDVVTLYHGTAAGERARAEFIRVFSKKELPRVMNERSIEPGSYEAVALLLDLKLARSRSEAWRLIAQGAVEITPVRGETTKIKNPRDFVEVSEGTVIRAGKTKFTRVR